MTIKNDYCSTIQTHNKRLPIVFKSILIGIGVSLVTIFYRLALTSAEKLSNSLYNFIGENQLLIFPLFMCLGALGWFVGHLVKRNPQIGGSGIPQVKGQIMGYFKYPWISTLLTKFIGGTVSILAGLSVGREGPSIQLGAATAHGLGERLSNTRTERKILIASGASAGLATAFNAPLAGVMFALEEIFKYFSPTILLATITSAVTADFIATIFFGLDPIFNFTLNNVVPLNNYWIIVVLGVIVGTFGAFYNYILIKTMSIYKTIAAYNANLKFIIPFIVAGILGLTFPIVLGGGEHIVESLNSSNSLRWLLLVLVVKFFFSMISFGSGVPGGIFFPLLVIGSLIGGIFANITINALGMDPDLFYNFVILAMAGFFTAIVRAPITGVILLTEMTGSFSQLSSLTAVSIVAYVTADLLKSAPIYDSLLDLQLKEKVNHKDEQDDFKKVTIDTIVHHGSKIENCYLKDLGLPSGNLVIAIRRHGKDITPNGLTKIQPEDHLIILTSVNQETCVRELLQKLTDSD
ncbi:ClC family H(+)/Cl(-) exchange transporter [Alkalibacter mobilis]|uniref:ClC family H(+)/Cl(-) exchange transporter n=1 Tax=Alkalibacter mobilis TaxID=2787712 RepID=UPI00189D793D|nr:ClC family H(+)/Cl(-) exchange transporter [Alkalibacter mobilis]MBF7097555.1 chloride channel protein [Alkalibacter mobilis]